MARIRTMTVKQKKKGDGIQTDVYIIRNRRVFCSKNKVILKRDNEKSQRH